MAGGACRGPREGGARRRILRRPETGLGQVIIGGKLRPEQEWNEEEDHETKGEGYAADHAPTQTGYAGAENHFRPKLE